jgi:hypothetical protein
MIAGTAASPWQARQGAGSVRFIYGATGAISLGPAQLGRWAQLALFTSQQRAERAKDPAALDSRGRLAADTGKPGEGTSTDSRDGRGPRLPPQRVRASRSGLRSPRKFAAPCA